MIVVTGAAGFIGSNLVLALNARGQSNILAVDDLTQGDKFCNLVDANIAGYLDKDNFIVALNRGEFDGEIDVILHQGACSDTMNHDGRMMMEQNYRYALSLLEFCQDEEIPLIYASSGSVYGGSSLFHEDASCERPLNIYGYSKLLFDQKVRQILPLGRAQVVGLRYFNVYGPREQHKGRMASVVFRHHQQYSSEGKVRLFGAHDGWEAGAQLRDFVFVDDVIRVNMHFLDHPQYSGIFNVGTGRARSFNDLALSVIRSLTQQEHLSVDEAIAQGLLKYVPFPDKLKHHYQSYTQADLSHLREIGYTASMIPLEDGVTQYMKWLEHAAPPLRMP